MFFKLHQLRHELSKENITLYLSNNVHHLGALVPEGKINASATVDIGHVERLVEVFGVPKSVLPLTHSCKTSCEDLVRSPTENGAGRLVPFMSLGLLQRE